MVDALNGANLSVLAKALFVAALLGAFGGTLKKIEPVLKVPLTRVIDIDGRSYEVGYDITATEADWSPPRVNMQGQPRVAVWGYEVQGPKEGLEVPEPIRSRVPFFQPKLG